MKPVLTIAIPTWNRSELLGKLLDELIQQVRKNQLGDVIEIVVSNNNSEDDTETIVQGFKSQNSFINYHKNSTNIGAKLNVIKCMELANSTHVLLIGDDDSLKADALVKIVSFLTAHPETGVLLDLSRWRDKKNYLSVQETSIEQLVVSFFYFLGNAGVFVTKTDYIHQGIDRFGLAFFNECWPQTQLIFLGLQNSQKDRIFVSDVGLVRDTFHGDVMLYTSMRVWRTEWLELLRAGADISESMDPGFYGNLIRHISLSSFQTTLNILQVGLFVESSAEKRETRQNMWKHRKLFRNKTRLLLNITCLALALPSFISKPIGNLFILLLRGPRGLKNKSVFAKKELEKRRLEKNNKEIAIRRLDFETD